MVLPLVAGRFFGSGRRRHFLRKYFLLLIAWPAGALALAAGAWSTLHAHWEHELALAEQDALKQVAALSRSYAGHLRRTLYAIDQHLLFVRYEWESSDDNLRLEDLERTGRFPAGTLPDMAILDRDGRLLTSTIAGAQWSAPAETVRYLMAAQGSVPDALHIGVPTHGFLAHRDIVPFSRPLSRHGGFNGVVTLALAPERLTANYDEAILGSHGILSAVRSDGLVLAASMGQSDHPTGALASVSMPRFTAQAGSAVLDGNELFPDRRSRYAGWQTVEGYPLVALAALDKEEALAPYRAGQSSEYADAVWATLALGLFTTVAMMLSARLAWRKYKTEATYATFRMATEEGKEGFYIARPVRDASGNVIDFEVIDCNQRGAEMIQTNREALAGTRLSTLYEGGNPERLELLMQWLCRAMEKGFYETDVQVSGTSRLAIDWAHIKILRSNGDLAVTLRDISESKAHLDELERRSNEDFLTGLPNRRWAQTYLPRAIERAAADNAMLALLFVDLDGFKKVNDTMGHKAGDELLQSAADRLRNAVRPHDHVVRLGGDEFLVIIEHIERDLDAAQVAERIVQSFGTSFGLSQGMHAVGTSIGISTFPNDGTDADTLLHNADIAMYSVKTGAKGSYRFYDQKFYDALRARIEQESELCRALELDQFVMHYQPRVSIATGETSSMEALVRWHHPVRGLLEPLEFIPLAEETGHILRLGELVIDKVCSQLDSWSRAGQQPVPVSINVSPRQFNEADIARILSAALLRHRVDPAWVEIEVTESSMMGNNATVSKALSAIRRLGVKLLVDDFGTGYSSLSQLQRLDFDMLKVDRAFTADIGKTEKGDVFFKAIITMAHAIGMRVVAEGVESEAQLKILESLHCDEVQGFYIGKPLPAAQVQSALPGVMASTPS